MGTKCRRVHKEKTSWRAVTSPLDLDPIWPYIGHMNKTTYTEILKVWNSETPDDFAIFSELYYEMFGGEEEIPYTTSSTCSSFFPYNWCKIFTLFPHTFLVRWQKVVGFNVTVPEGISDQKHKLIQQSFSPLLTTSNETFLPCSVCYPRC